MPSLTLRQRVHLADCGPHAARDHLKPSLQNYIFKFIASYYKQKYVIYKKKY